MTESNMQKMQIPYTPTTEEVRNRFTFHASGIRHPEFEEQFDRWLAEVKAEAWEEGYDSGAVRNYGDFPNNPYRKET